MGRLRKLLGRRTGERYGWHGDYPDWDTAAALADGYHSGDILQRVVEATRAVRRGDAVFERDSVLFDRPQYNWPLTACLCWVAARCGGRLAVVDFGGSLGSTWHQNREFLEPFDVRWTVVEQPGFVAAGKAEFSGGGLAFADSITEAAADGAELFLASSVLQYVEHPEEVLDEVRRQGFAFALFDRTAMTSRPRSRITVQRVPEDIYSASYPARFFCHADFLGALEADYRVVAEWAATVDKTRLEDCGFKGALLERRRG